MDSEKPKLLLVDDSALDLQVLVENLRDDFTLMIAKNGAKAIEIASGNHPPEVVLLDVNMPDMSGYTCCERIRAMPQCQKIEILFVSANHTLEEKLAGYESGGSDYITKPIQPEEIRKKVSLAAQRFRGFRHVVEEAQMAKVAVSSAHREWEEQAIVVAFLRDTLATEDCCLLAEEVVQAVGALGLSVSILLNYGSESVCLSTSGEVPPLERELLIALRGGERLTQSGSRLMIHLEQLSLLVKNMPMEASPDAARLRDCVELIAEGAGVRVAAIEMVKHSQRMFSNCCKMMSKLRQHREDVRNSGLQDLESLVEEINRQSTEMGLTESQEKQLHTLLQQFSDRGGEWFSDDSGVEQEMENLFRKLAEGQRVPLIAPH